MSRFELSKLTSYDDDSLIKELGRVAELVPEKILTRKAYDRLGRADSTTFFRRFGSWEKALTAAGLKHRFSDINEPWTREEIIEKLKSIASRSQRPLLTAQEAERSGVSLRPIRRLFGSFRAALKAAGLGQSKGGVRFTDEECFENLLTIWTVLGRQPSCSEIDRPPSKMGSGAYKRRWGSWRRALQAFVDRVNEDGPSEVLQAREIRKALIIDIGPKRTIRNIPLGLRYTVLKRDRFRCVICGRNPALDPSINLQVDHIKAWAQGGETVLENLRSLCIECNLGKGCRDEEISSGL